MKTKLTLTICVAVLALASANAAPAVVPPSAFALVKQGDKYVGDQSKDRVVQIHSERSAGTLMPNIWYVVYYDPDAPLKAVQVKFGAGEKMDVSRPFRLLEPITGQDRVLDSAKLKIDSDRALAIATGMPLLHGLALSSSQFVLEHGDLGPRWKIDLWAFKVNNPARQAHLGTVFIAADTGEILKADLHPDAVN